MQPNAKFYVTCVIAAGTALLLWSLPGLAPASWPVFLICLGLAAILAPLKLRLPGLQGTYAPTFMPILYGLAHLSLAETLLIGLTVGLAQSCLMAKTRPQPIQVAFNTANLAVSIGICFFAAGLLRDGAGLSAAHPAVAVLLAGLYFVVNTGLVSGVLSLLKGTALREVAASWYVWSLPYHLTGAAAVTLSPYGVSGIHWEGVLVVFAMLGLLHFYCGLAEQKECSRSYAGTSEPLPGAARFFLYAVVAAAAGVFLKGLSSHEFINPARMGAMVILIMIFSALKVQLPGLKATISLAFVLLIYGVTELSLLEVSIMAAVSSLVQTLWSPAHRHKAMRVIFSMATTVLACATAFAAIRLVPGLNQSLIAQVLSATVTLYGMSTLLVSTMLTLIERQSLGSIVRRSHFWVFPYYLVGAAAAAIVIATSRDHGWIPSLLVLPTVVLVYVSYRIQIAQKMAATK